MNASDALIMWTPAYATADLDAEPGTHPMAGQVEVAHLRFPYGEYMRERGLLMDDRLEGYVGPELLAMLFIRFHTLVARDGISPEVAHREFLKIDEYRWVISRDTSGAEDGPEDFYRTHWPEHFRKETSGDR